MTTKIKFPKISKRDLKHVQRVIKYGTRQEKESMYFTLRATFGIDWDRKSLNVKTGAIECEWIKTLNDNWQWDRVSKR